MHITPPTPSPAPDARPLSTWAATLLIGTVLATALVLGLVIERFARHHEIKRSRTALAQMGWQLRDQLDRGMAERGGSDLDQAWARELSRGLLVPELAHSGIEVFILRADGEVLLGPAGTRMDLPALRAAAAADPGWFASGQHLNAVVAMQGHGRHPGLGWVVVVRQPVELALAEYGKLRTQLALATLLVVLGIGLAAPGLAQRLAHPLLQIMQWLALAQPQSLRLRGRAFREAHELAESLDALRTRERLQADALRELNASLESRVAERTAELQKARRDLRNIVNALPTAIGYWDRELLNRFANEAWRDWFGLDPVAVPGWHFSAVLGAAAHAALQPRLEAALAGEAQTFEHTFKRPDGAGERHALVHHIPDLVDGEVRGLYTLAHDITELIEGRRALAGERQRLRHNKAFLERVGRVCGVGGWQLDLRTGQAEWTAEMRRILGTGPDAVQSLEAALQRYPGAAREQVRAAVRAAIERGEPYDLEVPYTTLDGRSLWVRTAGQAEYDPADPHGPPVRLLGTFQDISERHAAATALREAKQAAESANAAKSEFLANMSHEIRTPLNAVIGLSYLLEQSALDAGQKDSVAKIQAAGRSLLAVLNDVLDLAKIEARQVELESRPFDLAALLGDLRALFGAQAQAKGLALSVADAPPGLDRVVGDDTRLRQILVNLLSNALKFTEAGEVALRLRADPPREGRVQLHFEVSDTGIGICAQALQRLFTPFTQADASTTRRFGGTGLGLSIVHRLAALMGGRAWAESEPGRGSRFMVELVLGVEERSNTRVLHAPQGSVVALPAPLPQGSLALPGVRVLVVDDSGINLEVARRVLELHGAVVSTCGDGLQALQWLRAYHDRCDVVLMDVQMPVMDGLEATRRLRAELGLARLPVLALSAGALESERAGARAAGMDDFLAKPLEPQALVGTVRWHVEQAQGQPLPCEAQPGTPGCAPAAGDWPEIEGIDMPAVAQRLGQDRQLLRSLVGRLLRDFADLEDGGAAELQRQDDAGAFAARMHRLRGSAALLGMERLETVARALESGLREHRLSTAELQALGNELARTLRDMRSACAAGLAGAGEGAAEMSATAATATPAALDRAQLQGFLRMLSAQSLDAEQAFEQLAPQLHAALGADAWQRLREAMESLEFEAARAMVETGIPG